MLGESQHFRKTRRIRSGVATPQQSSRDFPGMICQ
jgi:hypothetical protein